MFRLSLILFIIISILLNCRTDIKPEKNDSFVESRQSSGNSDIIPRISEYADYESIVSNQVDSFISDTLSDTMIINTQNCFRFGTFFS